MKTAGRGGGLLLGLLTSMLISGAARADDTRRTEVDLGGFKSAAPADWQPMKTTSEMRAYQFKVPAKQGNKNAELTIFHFRGGAGSADANVRRWKGLFQPPEGKTIDEVAKTHTLKLAEGKVKGTYLDIHGTYHTPVFGPGQKSEALPHTRMLAVVFETDNGPYYIRLVGPEKTVAAHKKEFDHWLHAFKP